MQKTRSVLTVYFEAPYWVGIYERHTGGQLTVCKIVFGAEPKDYEVYQCLLDNWHRLAFSPPVQDDETQAAEKRPNPKRAMRDISKQMHTTGVGTKAQQAMQLQREAGKEARKKKTRQQREEESEKQFTMKQAKKKQKHKGH